MSQQVIQVEELSKRYVIGERQQYTALRHLLGDALKAPLLMFRPAPPQATNHRPQNIWALKDVSFEVKEGEVLGLIGRNGAGKSTLLKILARITRPTSGHAEIHGRVGSLLEVGTGFHPELTGRENVYLSGAVLGMKKKEIDRKFDEIVAFSEVEEFIDTPLKHYSTGMQMRLAFAVAAHLEPEILLVDEVLAVGDAAFQRKCLGKMSDVARQGRTVLFVSHNMTAMRSLCSRAFLLERGKIVYSGPVAECIDGYLVSGADYLAGEIITRDIPRPPEVAHDPTFRVTRVRFETPSNQALLYSGKVFSVLLDFEVTKVIDDVVIGIAVHSSYGLRLFECRSLDSYGPIRELRPGSYSIRCALRNNPLNPGLYRLSVGSRCQRKGLDWLPDVMTFQVEMPDRLDSLWLEDRSGLVRQTSEWSPPSPCEIDSPAYSKEETL